MLDLHWVKNGGQFPAAIAWVANLTEHSPQFPAYHGAGIVILSESTLEYIDADDIQEAHALYPNAMIAMASAYQLSALHGTPLAAALNVLSPAP